MSGIPALVRVVRRPAPALSLVLGALLGLVLAGVLAAPPAAAHASLVSTDPSEGTVLDASPEQVRFTFDEPVRLAGEESVRFFDASGAELSSDATVTDAVMTVRIDPGLADGTYVLAWRVVSADGHPIAGALTFSIGAPSENVVTPDLPGGPGGSAQGATADLAFLQGLVYLGVFTAAGLCLFVYWLATADLRGRLIARLRATQLAAAIVTAVTVMLLVPFAAIYQRGADLTALGDAELWFGDLGRPEVAAALLVTAGVLLATLGLRRDVRGVALGGSMLALGSLAVVGHTRSYGPAALVMGGDVLHVLAAATWAGGLLGLLLTVPGLTVSESARLLTRFSARAAGLLVLVAITGTVLGWRILRGWAALVESSFGQALLVKVALVLAVVAIAAWNRFRLLPRLVDEKSEGASAVLRQAMAVEAAVVAGVLLVTGALVDRSPSGDSSAVAPPAAYTAVSGDVRVYVRLEPGRVGSNEVVVQVQDLAGEPVEPYAEPVVTAFQGDLSIGRQVLENADSGTYRATLVLPRGGTWTVRVSVRTGRFSNPVLDVAVPVN